MNRPAALRTDPLHDRRHVPQEWTTQPRLQVLDLFSGRGGVGQALAKWLTDRRTFLGVDIEAYGEDYPGPFLQADLLDPDHRPFSGVTADVVWVSFPCNAYTQLSRANWDDAEYEDPQTWAFDTYPRLTDEFREWLLDIAGHYIIENVPRATALGDLHANCRLNGLAFGEPFDLERHFETTFPVPDAYTPGVPDIPVDTRENQSVRALAAAKGVPTTWPKQAVRSAIPWQYVWWLLSYCPAIGWPRPTIEQASFSSLTGSAGAHSMFGTGECGGHRCHGACHGDHDEHWS